VKARILHNPRCSKSRATLQLLTVNNVEVEIIDYQQTPPTVSELRSLTKKLGMTARELVRFNEALATELGLAKDDVRSEDQWLALLSMNPRLLERPIVEIGERAVLGRPPENVLTLL
jgi:arsenate reductase